MESVMISIRPKWCEFIASGKKTVEVRKTIPKYWTPFRCYIYCTLDGGMKGDMIHALGGDTIVTCGKVIGEFVCDKVETYIADYFVGAVDIDGNIRTKPVPGEFGYWITNKERTCLTYNEILEYGGGKNLYGWNISDLKIYDKPKELSDFVIPTDGTEDCCDHHVSGKYSYCYGCPFMIPENDHADIKYDCYAPFHTAFFRPLKQAPQSWCYVEDLDEDEVNNDDKRNV